MYSTTTAYCLISTTFHISSTPRAETWHRRYQTIAGKKIILKKGTSHDELRILVSRRPLLFVCQEAASFLLSMNRRRFATGFVADAENSMLNLRCSSVPAQLPSAHILSHTHENSRCCRHLELKIGDFRRPLSGFTTVISLTEGKLCDVWSRARLVARKHEGTNIIPV